nr:hypothetical protein CFP56_36437 [Quercus suber]
MPSQQSPLLALPTELRLAIYTYVLAPTGHVHLTSSPSRRYAVCPIVTPALLRVSRQVHAEAQGILYSANEVCLAVNAHEMCWPLVAEQRIAQRALERLERVFLLLDCVGRFPAASYAEVDFTPLEALVRMRRLRIGLLEDAEERFWRTEPVMQKGEEGEEGEEEEDEAANSQNVLAEVLRRVPPECVVVYGTEEGSEARKVVEMVAVGKMKGIRVSVSEASRELLEEVAGRVPAEQKGVKSGATKDVFLRARQQYLATR